MSLLGGAEVMLRRLLPAEAAGEGVVVPLGTTLGLGGQARRFRGWAGGKCDEKKRYIFGEKSNRIGLKRGWAI